MYGQGLNYSFNMINNNSNIKIDENDEYTLSIVNRSPYTINEFKVKLKDLPNTMGVISFTGDINYGGPMNIMANMVNKNNNNNVGGNYNVTPLKYEVHYNAQDKVFGFIETNDNKLHHGFSMLNSFMNNQTTLNVLTFKNLLEILSIQRQY